jgi:serine/threonine-protein kinase RsbW
MHITLALTLPTDKCLLPTTRHFLAAYLELVGLPVDVTDEVVLAMDEACSNVVKHAFPEGHGSYWLRADLRPEEVVIVVEDDGVGFDPMKSRSGVHGLAGRGLEIIRRLMTSVDVESPTTSGGTRLSMRRRVGISPHRATTSLHRAATRPRPA